MKQIRGLHGYSERSPKWIRNWGLFVLGLSILLFFRILIGFNGLYGQDSHAYYAYVSKIAQYVENGIPLPPFYWSKGYPFIAYLFSKMGFSVLVSMQLIVGLSLIGTLYLVRSILWQLHGKESWGWLLLAGLSQIYFLRSGIVLMSDAPAMFLLTAAFWSAIQFYSHPRWVYAFLVVIFCVGAVAMRYAVLPLLIAPVLICCVQVVRQFRVRAWYLIGSVLLIGVLLLIGYWDTQVAPLLKEGMQRWGLEHFFSRQLTDRDGITHKTVPNVLYVFGNFGHLGFLSFGLFLLPFVKRTSDPRMVLTAIGVAVYLLFLAGIGTQNYRFLVVSHPLVLILLFPAFMRLKHYLVKRRLFLLFATGVLLFNTAFAVFSFRKTLKVYRNEREIATTLRSLVSKKQTIYSFYVDQSFPSYGIENPIRNFYMDDFHTFESGALVVFNPSEFERQWKGHRVMNNWNRLVDNYHLDTVRVFESNWIIYRIR